MLLKFWPRLMQSMSSGSRGLLRQSSYLVNFASKEDGMHSRA